MDFVKQRKVWLNEEDWKNLQLKAKEYFQGKGYLSKYLRKISNSNKMLFLEGIDFKGEIIIKN